MAPPDRITPWLRDYSSPPSSELPPPPVPGVTVVLPVPVESSSSSSSVLCEPPAFTLFLALRATSVHLVLGSLQVHCCLTRLLRFQRSLLGDTTCHGVELGTANQVLEVSTRREKNVHRLDVLGCELLDALRPFAADGDSESTQLAQLDLVAVEQLLRSPSWILLPLSSCSTRHSHISEITPFTVPREYTPLWSEMCLANFSSDQISRCGRRCAWRISPATRFQTLGSWHTPWVFHPYCK